jgi:multidrug efflux pump
MGGLLVATLLTLFFLPALYALWYRVPRRLAPAADEVAPWAEPEAPLLAAE